jgi:hypothetical protein
MSGFIILAPEVAQYKRLDRFVVVNPTRTAPTALIDGELDLPQNFPRPAYLILCPYFARHTEPIVHVIVIAEVPALVALENFTHPYPP